MTQDGKVISTEGNLAKVLVMRKTACESCKSKALCAGGCSHEKPMEVYAKNQIGAGIGDDVVLATDSRLVLGMTFCIFILPIVLAFAVFLVFSETCAFPLSVCYAATALSFIISALILCLLFNRKLKKNISIEIVKIKDRI